MRNPKSNSNSTPVTYTATNVLSEIQKCIKEMKKNWDIIRNFNIENKQIDAYYDIKAVYQQNVKLENKIVDLKLYSLCINLGLTSTAQLSNKSSFPTIYILSQLKSRKDNLQTIQTKYNSSTHRITLNEDFIKNEIKNLNREIIKCEVELDKFNKIAKLTA